MPTWRKMVRLVLPRSNSQIFNAYERPQLSRKHTKWSLYLVLAVVFVRSSCLLHLRQTLQNTHEDWVLRQFPIHKAPIFVKGDHNPHFYEHNLTNVLARGGQFLTAKSGCRVASWVYQTNIRKDDIFWRYLGDCAEELSYKELDVSQLQENDTIYVVVKSLPRFVEEVLPQIKVPIVLLSGNWIIARAEGNWLTGWRGIQIPKLVTHAILTNPYVISWFCHNPDFYNTIGLDSSKLRPLAYGLQPLRAHPYDVDPVDTYRRVFFQHLKLNKTQLVHYAYFNPETNPNRSNIPINGVKQPMEDYLHSMASSYYVPSPNGDRPECYRHYEAFGLGTIPLTELNFRIYSHIPADAARFQFSDWAHVDLLEPPPQTANFRCLVFEEYWLEDIERVVGRKLQWWDVVRRERSLLSDFDLNYADCGVQQYLSTQ